MKVREAQALGLRISALLRTDSVESAYELLIPVLSERTPFAALRRIGSEIGHNPLERIDPLLKRIAEAQTVAGWPVISGALAARLGQDLSGSLQRCRIFIMEGAVWYAADTLGEWVIGQAWVDHFDPALDLIAPWREDRNNWVRRAVGTSIHYWAKRSWGKEEFTHQAILLLSFLEPMFEEQQVEVVKGIGWALKTLGKYYPNLVTAWLNQQVVQRQRPYRPLMLRKAMTYLSKEQKNNVIGSVLQ